ncbi:restriction endonuclease subunit S [Acinetobacter lwoffii]|uniref:restriction endonuclease subunit S n=1 Tax=Acinetobacter lwoffii TaxID=28090 RepID=UPI000A3243AB|nr:restriction endonuclease subunit S [Acinetobacter lwoffii]AUC07509.1 restriction endonuclease subunit S [Acinetobacter lwoffii]
MAKYQKYAEYKDSGVEWLGEIPSHWNLFSLKRAVEGCTNGFWGSEPDGSNDLCVLRVADFNRHNFTVGLDKLTYRSISQKEAENRLLKKGDLLLEKSGGGEKTLVGCVVQFNEDFQAITSNFVAKMTPKKHIVSRFLTFAFSHLYAGRVNFPSIKQTTGIQNLDSEGYLMEKFVFPNREEQNQIANFLDHETAQIDSLIAKQEKLIELLKEKRQAVISNLVAVQNNEPTIKLKYAVEILAGYSFSSAGFQIENDNGIPLLRGINVGVGSIKWDECVWWSKSDTNGLERYLLQEGDLVFGMDRPWISSGARVAEIKQTDLPSYLVQRVARIRCIDGFYQPYVKLVLGSKEFKSFIESDLTGVSVPHISTDQIISFEVRNLTYEQQVFETDKVIGFMFQVEELIDKAQSAIQLMQERRTALISSAVTGKIDVRNWQHPNEAKTGLSA